MKCISVLFLTAAAAFAQTPTLTTGQAARAVIGQTTFTSQDSNASDTILGAASGIAYAADTLFVADSNQVGALPSNHRVLLFQNLSSMLPTPTAELPYVRKCPVCVGQATVVLGQPDFVTSTVNLAATASTLRLPTAVASDGVHLVVADTDHNRVLIWNRIPSVNNQPADVVVGQPDFTTLNPPPGSPTAKTLRGPQGVWILNGKLYVADTQNNRVLIYNHIPTANGAAADVVLGVPNFTTAPQPDLTQQKTSASATNLLNPVSVTSDGVHLFVTDLGYNRILIWNSIPTTNAAPADVEIGQPDMNSSIANNSYSADANGTQTAVLCTTPTGKDSNGNNTYPPDCNATVSFPRFALVGGGRLFVADGGNDRVMVFNQIPTQNAASADLIIGQIGGTVNQASDAADSLRVPMSLAWDGTNLYVSDAYNRRITVYSLAPAVLPYQAVRNAASLAIYANGQVTIGGTVTANDVATITLGYNLTSTPASSTTTTTSSSSSSTNTITCTSAATVTTQPAAASDNTCIDYSYTVKSTDTLISVVQALVDKINTSFSGAGDPNVFAVANPTTLQVLITSRVAGSNGNNVSLSATVSTSATLTISASSATLSGGGDAASIAPGSLVTFQVSDGTVLSAQTVSADLTLPQLPTQLGGTEVYFNGIRAPIQSVSPSSVTAQVPWEVLDSTSINAYIRSVMSDGTIMVTTPVAVTIVPANPGIYAQPDTTPSMGLVYHGSSSATGIVSVDGTVTANDVVTVAIEDRSYSYTVQSGDTLTSVRDNLIPLINQDPQVTASPSAEYTRIILQALVEGPEGQSITYSASATTGATVIMTAFSGQHCCANVAGSPVTTDNPAIPGEFITVYATGLGLPTLNDANTPLIQTGVAYPLGAPPTTPTQPSAVSSLAGGSTADVIAASLLPGTVGLFEVTLHLNSSLPTDPLTSLTIAQDVYVSNVVRFAVVKNAPPGQ